MYNKKLAEELKRQFTCLGENTEKYISFSVQIKRSYKKGYKGKEIARKMSYRLQFIDSARFIGSSLSNLVNSLAEGIHKTKCKYLHDDKNVKLLEVNTNIVNATLNIQTLAMV